MPKIIGENVPPALQALWETLHAQGKASQGTSGTVRAKKRTKKPTKKTRRNLDLIGLQRIADLVAFEFFTLQDEPIPKDFIFNLTRDLVMGQIPAKYFRKCKVESAITLESQPTYTADLNPPPYGFRTQNFMPSVPAYPNGNQVAGDPSYTGQKVGTLFADVAWRWRKIVYKANAVKLDKGEERVLMRWDVRIDIAAAARGSRPMVSLNLHAALSTDTGGALSSTEPPLMNKTTFYWRWKVPPSSPPYYNSFQVRREVKPLARILKKTGTGLYTRYVVNAGNRPMMGRGFNNNDFVNTAMTGDPELWEIKPPCQVWNLDMGNAWNYVDSDDVVWSVTTTSAYVNISIAKVATAVLNLRFQSGQTIETLTISQVLTGNWDWYFDVAGTGGDGALPKDEEARAIGVSCYGDRVIFSVHRYSQSYLTGARGFILLALDSITSGTVSTIADTPACNQISYHTSTSDYGDFGIQVDKWWLDPTTFWCWFDDADNIIQVQSYEYSDFPYPWNTGFTEIGIKIDGVTVSKYRWDYQGSGIGSASLDGYNDSGRLKGWECKLGLLDKNRSLTRVNPNWDTRFIKSSSQDFYSAFPMQTNEAFWPNSQMKITFRVFPDNTVRLSLTMYRYFWPSPPGVYAFGSLPWYVKSDEYLGYTIGYDSIKNTIDHNTY